MTDFEPSNDSQWGNFVVNTPQPINVKLDGDFVTLVKQDVPVVKFNVEDKEALSIALTLLNGLIRVGAVFGEIENVRDILKEIYEQN